MDLLTEWTGYALLIALVLAVLCAVDKMTHTTDNVVRYAMALIGAAAVGQLFGAAAKGWEPYLDLALYGGVAGLLFADRRQRLGLWARRTAVALMALASAVVVLAVMAMPARAQAPAPAPARMDCQLLAKAVSSAMIFRDVGADLKKFEAYVRASVGAPAGPLLESTLREVRRMWSTAQPPEEAAFAVYQRCIRQLGDMGREG